MEKYHYKIEGIQETPCMLSTDNRIIGSKKCLNCQHFQGIDIEEMWVKCYLYNCVNGYFALQEETTILEQKINELEGVITNLQGSEV